MKKPRIQKGDTVKTRISPGLEVVKILTNNRARLEDGRVEYLADLELIKKADPPAA